MPPELAADRIRRTQAAFAARVADRRRRAAESGRSEKDQLARDVRASERRQLRAIERRRRGMRRWYVQTHLAPAKVLDV